jgi:hypothetical protein
LARSLPGQNLLPAPKGRKVPAFGVKFYTEVKQIIKYQYMQVYIYICAEEKEKSGIIK